MAFLHQLRLLLWKNGLGIIRQPVWSLILLLWPIIIFIILAITRHQFPPIFKDACYVSPRNLPSSGFFPFLQTLMCNMDSTCHNKSRQLTSRSSHPRSTRPKDSGGSIDLSTMESLFKDSFASINSVIGRNGILHKWNSLRYSPLQVSPSNISFMDSVNNTSLGDQEALQDLLESMGLLKKSFCKVTLSALNHSSATPFTYALVMFCKSNDTLLEVSLLTVNQILTDLMQSRPGEVVTVVGQAVMLFDLLQKEPALWGSLLSLPRVLAPAMAEQKLSDLEEMLTNFQGAMQVIQRTFPQASGPISTVHPYLANSINVINYMQEWPGKDAYITLEDVVTLDNGPLSEITRQALREIKVPLHQALGLTLDQSVVRSYICNGSANSLVLTACATGIVDMVLGWVSPSQVAMQVALVWSRDVAPGDLDFARGLLHSLMGSVGSGGQGGSNQTRAKRSADEPQPQSVEEELFLYVGQVVLELVHFLPEVSPVVDSLLSTLHSAMKTTSLGIQTVEGIMDSILKDARHIQSTYLSLLSNKTEAEAYLLQLLRSTVEVVMMVQDPQSHVTCETVVGCFRWLLNTETLEFDLWKTMICQNETTLQQALLPQWMPLIQQGQELYLTITGQRDCNITVAMILSEWQKLYNTSANVGLTLEKFTCHLGEDYWRSWLQQNTSYDVAWTLVESPLLLVETSSTDIEQSAAWPQIKPYIYMANWILHYQPGVTFQPPNCSVDMSTFALHCDADVDLHQFTQATAQLLQALSCDPQVLTRHLKATVNALQYIFGDIYKNMLASSLTQAVPSNQALSTYLNNLLHRLDGFSQLITHLNDSELCNPSLLLPHVYGLLQSTGLTPLMPLLSSQGPISLADMVDVVVKLGRLNQHIFNFGDMDPSLYYLENLMTEFLSMESNLTLPFSFSLGQTLITYSASLRPEDVAHLIKAILPFANQSSAGITESVLRAMELLKPLADAPGGDPTSILLGYIHQLRGFLASALKLRRIDQFWLPNAQLTTTQVTDLYLTAMDILNLIDAENIQNLTQLGPDAALQVVLQKMLPLLPSELQQHTLDLVNDLQTLINQMLCCAATGQNCTEQVAEIFTFLERVVEMVLNAEGDVAIVIAPTNPLLTNNGSLDMMSTIFSLVLNYCDAAHLNTANQILHFIRLITKENLTVSEVQSALRESKITLAELDAIIAQTGAANINEMILHITDIISVRQCFEPPLSPLTSTQCAMGLTAGIAGFLANVPALQNHTAILSLIPEFINKTITESLSLDITDPHMQIIETLNSILSSIRLGLQQTNQSSPQILNELRVIERLLRLAANTQPFQGANTTLLEDPNYALKIYLQIARWYFERLDNATSTSAYASLLYPFFSMVEMQFAIQTYQAELNLFVGKEVSNLMEILQNPINGEDVSKIGQTVIEIFRGVVGQVKLNLEVQNAPINSTELHMIDRQINHYLDLIATWMKDPNVTSTLTSMLQWGSPSLNISTPGNDLQWLLLTINHLLTPEQSAYLSEVNKIIQALNKALEVAEQPYGLQSNDFVDAILESAQITMQSLSAATGPIPLLIQENVLGIVENLLSLVLYPELGYDMSRNVTLDILWRAETVIRQTVPQIAAGYLLGGIQVMSTYLKTASTPSGPDKWNEIILNEMETIRELLPPGSAAQAYISTIANITQIILESGQGSSNLWTTLANASLGNMGQISDQISNILSNILSFITGQSALDINIPSLEVFTDISDVLEQILLGEAAEQTWTGLQGMTQALLSAFQGTPLWQQIPPVACLMDDILGAIVHNMKAENALILSLEKPLGDLVSELVQSVNSSHFNLSQVQERLLVAIEFTLQAVEQANGTLGCQEVLAGWRPVVEAAGLMDSALAMWCNVSLQPVLEAYHTSQSLYEGLSLNSYEPGAMTVNATAAKIVEALRSFYQVNANRTHIGQRLLTTLSNQLSVFASMSHQVQAQWNMLFLDMQLKQGLTSLQLLSDELLGVAPGLQPLLEAVEKAVIHLVNNHPSFQNATSAQNIIMEAGAIFLSSLNVTADSLLPMLMGDFSNLSGMTISTLIKDFIQLIVEMMVFGDAPMVYQALEDFIASNEVLHFIENLTEAFAWLSSNQVSFTDLLTQVLPRMEEAFRALLSFLTQMNLAVPNILELFSDLAKNVVAMLRQMMWTSDLLAPLDQQWSQTWNHAGGGQGMVRRRREAPEMPLMMPPTMEPPMRVPMDDFLDLIYIDYPALFKAASVPPTPLQLIETANMAFSNPDLSVFMKGATASMPWGLNSSREETIDAALGVLSFVTHPSQLQMISLNILVDIANMIPEGFPFAHLIKDITVSLVNESQENLLLMEQTFQTLSVLLNTSVTDGRFPPLIRLLTSQVCTVENMTSVQKLLQALPLPTVTLCNTLMPGVQIISQAIRDTTDLSSVFYQTLIGEPSSYKINSNWTSALGAGLGFNTSSLRSLNISVAPPAAMTVAEILRNETAFVQDVQRYTSFDPVALRQLMNATIPSNNMVILSWLLQLRQCSSGTYVQHAGTIFRAFCSMSAEDWYSFSLLMTRHLDTEMFIYRMVLSDDVQSLVSTLVQMVKFLTNMMDELVPTINKLQNYFNEIEDLNLVANREFRNYARGHKNHISTRATFTTLSRAMCSSGIMAIFGIAKLPAMSDVDPLLPQGKEREEMIKKFKIPHDASPFCMNLYLDMVNTTGGAIAWAFLKPMLMGEILFTPDTPLTRSIMEKSNATLHEFANLRSYSEEWIKSSGYLVNSAQILSETLPMLQNSLNNDFVKNFIEMQTDIDVSNMKATLSRYTNMTAMLERNKPILRQITALSNMMVNISSCVKFDRYRGYDSADDLNAEAQDLAKDRSLYASVIFNLPPDQSGSSRRRRDDATPPLPPKMEYTIRMHMDNVMRTDRVRAPLYIRTHHIKAAKSLRYTRGFIYLQENIDRAIIELQTGQKVPEPAVQLQPFPYPCHYHDDYLEAISIVFPIMLMISWVLFVADFTKKLVYERELRLHEYMKMMGVNSLSHFFAWFIECSCYLVFTIIVLTLVMKVSHILPHSDGFLLFLYFCDYGLSILAISFMVSSFFDKTYIAGLSGSLIYVLCFFPFIVMVALESSLTFAQKSALGLFAPTCFSHASQYVSRYETQGVGIQWNNSYVSPIAEDTASFGWLCWLMLIDSILYFIIGAYIRMVFPGKYGIPAPWYFPFKMSFWTKLCCCCMKGPNTVSRGLMFSNMMQNNQPVIQSDFSKEKGGETFSSQTDPEFSGLPVGVALHGLTKKYKERVAIQNLNVNFYESHVTSLLGHNGAGKTTTMSLLTGLFAPSSGSIEVYGRDMQSNMHDVRKDLGVCMQYDVHFDHMTTKEHLLLYGQIKAPHWTKGELHEQVNKILEDTGMYSHRHKLVGTLSGGMKRKLSISIAFIGGSRLVVLDEPTTGVDPCSRRSIWDIVMQYKKGRTIIMSTHHLDEAEVLSDRIAFLEKGGLKCCGSPFYLKDKLGQGYKLTLTRKVPQLQSADSEVPFDSAELKAFIQAHMPEARMKEGQVGDLVYSLPPFTSSSASSYRSLLMALDANRDALQLGCYGISDTTLEEVFLHLTQDEPDPADEDLPPLTVSEHVSNSTSGGFSEDFSFSDRANLAESSKAHSLGLLWQQIVAMVIKRLHHSKRDWKGLISKILLPVIFVIFAMGLGSVKSDLQHYPKLELSPALYNLGPSYSFFSNQNPSASRLVKAMTSYPGLDNACLDKPDDKTCSRNTQSDTWRTSGSFSETFPPCKCTNQEQVCEDVGYQPPHKTIPSSQTVYNLTGTNVESYLRATANDFIRNRYGGFAFGKSLPPSLQMDLRKVPANRTLTKVWYNPEGHHTMPAYLNSLNNFILRTNLPADKDPLKYAISVSSHPYFGRVDTEDTLVQGLIQILVALCLMTGYAIMTASFATYEVHEHHSGAKRLQHIAGISEPLYWVVNFVYDMVLYLIPVALTVGVIAAFQISAFTNRQNLGAVTLLLVLFGFSTFPWMYLLAGVFKEEEMAFIVYVCINLFIGVNTIMPTSILYFLGQIASDEEAIEESFHMLSKAFLIFPQFCFGNGLMELARTNMDVQILDGYGIDAYKNPFTKEALGWMFLSSIVQGLLFFTLRLLLNKWLIRTVRHLILGRKKVSQVSEGDDDEDVVAEYQRVSSGAASSDILQVNQLTKIYQGFSRKVHAVKRISLGIPAGECFGLLGVNGAGKTTTFKMLAGDVSPTDGTAQIKDLEGHMVDIIECRNKGINIGYCPQVDALDELLTGEEHLYFYARIRGIPKREIAGVVSSLIKKLELGYHKNTIAEGYSCGTRRKLSTALSLIGRPQILLLDEPSSGMDPRTKRHLWKIISEEVKGKCAVVLTSHSMEECEALCSRLAIMVKGQFRCLGSLQHIKNRFGSGFTVKMYLAKATCDVEAITSFMQHHFPSTFLKDQHSAMVEYHVPIAPGGVADIFDQLESNKAALQIKHFSVSQTTLDEVFINFAMGNVGMETVPLGRDEDLSSLDSIEAVET